MTTIARQNINKVWAERYMHDVVEEVSDCIAIIYNEDGYCECCWLKIDLNTKSIKCTRSIVGHEKIMGFYPMTQDGYKDAHHDIRMYAYHMKTQPFYTIR